MANTMVTRINGKQFIATSTRRKELELAKQAQEEEADYYEPLTASDIAWSAAIFSGLLISIIFTIIMIWGVL